MAERRGMASWSPALKSTCFGMWGFAAMGIVFNLIYAVPALQLQVVHDFYDVARWPLGIMFGILIVRGFVLERQGRVHPDEPKLAAFAMGMLLYFILLPISIVTIKTGAAPGFEVPLALLPAFAAAIAFYAYVRAIMQKDEMFVRMCTEALVFAAIATAITGATLGFLENAGLPRISILWVLPMLIAYWGVGIFLVNRRYA